MIQLTADDKTRRMDLGALKDEVVSWFARAELEKVLAMGGAFHDLGSDGALAGQKAKVGSSPGLQPGARLVREWNGSTHMVEVVDGGFVWNGERHRSLSVIARTITGDRWSGPRFFGLSSDGAS